MHAKLLNQRPLVRRAVTLAVLTLLASVGHGQTFDTLPRVLAGTVGSVDYRVNAAAAQVIVEVGRNNIPADGQTGVPIIVRVIGEDGKPLATGVTVTIEHSAGRVLLPGAVTDEFGPRGKDLDRTTTGVQLEVRKGIGQFTLLAPSDPQDVRLRITVGQQQAEGVVSFVPDLREMVAAGLVEGVINISGQGNPLQPVRSNDTFDREIRNFSRTTNDGKAAVAARAAVFLKGVVKGEYLLTAAYDSDKQVRSRLLSDIQPDEFYPVYGDSSLKGDEAKSSERLYVRVDKVKSYLLYGDFTTGDSLPAGGVGGATDGLQPRRLGAYNRSATGLRWHANSGSVEGNVFAFKDSLRQVVEEFSSQGSGPYGLRNSAVLQSSEKVEMVVRDRDQPSRVISTKPLFSLVDYTFEPFSGRIVLNSFLPSFDANLNPVSLRISYEVDQGGDTFWVVGADGQWHISNQLEVGGSAIQDQNPLAPNSMSSANVRWQPAPKTVVVAEFANTRSEVNTNTVNQTVQPGLAGRVGEVSGDAWRLELAHDGERTEARVFLGQSDPTFNNLAAPLNAGRGEAFARGAYKFTQDIKAYAQVQRSEDRNPGTSTSDAASLGLNINVTDRVVLDIGVRSLRESAGTRLGALASPFSGTTGLTGSIATGSGGGAVGFGNLLIDPATGLPIIQTGSQLPNSGTTLATAATQSDSVRAGIGFKVTPRFTVGAEVEHEVNGDPRERYAIGADYLLAERARLYARAEKQTGLSSPNTLTSDDRNSNALVFGVDSSYWRDTQLFSEYRLRDAMSGRDNQLASGVRNSWDFAPGMRLNTAYERTEVISGHAAQTDAIAVGVDYTANPLWRGSTKFEFRRSGDMASTPTNDAFDTQLWQVSVARKLDRDWTLLGRNYLLKTNYARGGEVFQDRVQVGAAYRPTDNNRFNALAKYEYKTEEDSSNALTGPLSSQAHIVSLHSEWHPSRPWWTAGRLAAKWQDDKFEGGVRDSFNAQMLSGRVVYDMTEKWDVGVMAATQFGQHGALQHAAGLELGYLLQQNLWLSAGYNASGFQADRDLSGYEYTQTGFYIRLRFKFDENLFAKDSKSINRTLDR